METFRLYFSQIADPRTDNARHDFPEVLFVALLGLDGCIVTAERMIEVARIYGTIENQLHLVLDVYLDENAARSRKDNTPQQPGKGSIKGKIKRAGRNHDFLLSRISHMR